MHITITQADGQAQGVAIGTVRLQWITKSGGIHQITTKNVIYVPNLFTNLISAPKMRHNGASFNSGNDTFTWMDDGEEFGSARLVGHHWLLNWSEPHLDTITPTSCASDYEQDSNDPMAFATSSEVLHSRLRHPGDQALIKTQSHSTGLEGTVAHRDGLCESCELGKSHRLVSRETQRRFDNVGDCLHMDSVGQITPVSASCNNTILNVMNNAAATRWADFLDGKEHVSEAAINKIKFVEQQSEKNVKKVRFDGGTEFFRMFLWYVTDSSMA